MAHAWGSVPRRSEVRNQGSRVKGWCKRKQASMARVTQIRPDFGLGFQVNVLRTFLVVLFLEGW